MWSELIIVPISPNLHIHTFLLQQICKVSMIVLDLQIIHKQFNIESFSVHNVSYFSLLVCLLGKK